jgi:predicted XRE-type DNA-binding protein
MASRHGERTDSVTRGTANVLADLGFPDAAERQAKRRLAYALNQVLDERKLSQADAAKVLGVRQPKVSVLRHYKLAGFSVETPDEPLDGGRLGRRDRDSTKASLAKDRPDQRRRGFNASANAEQRGSVNRGGGRYACGGRFSGSNQHAA